LALTVSYDGTDFAGSQRQPNRRTVQQELEAALGRVFGDGVGTVFAGRTDRGVHAVGQVVGCDDRKPSWTPAKVRAALNAHLPDDVAVTAVERRPPEFHARYDARWREYRYRIWSGPPEPLARRYVWRRTAALDGGAIDEALKHLIGRHDFATFAGSGLGVPWSDRSGGGRGTVRTVRAVGCGEAVPWWGPPGGGTLLEVTVVADGFLPQMVRSIVGAAVEVGRGAREPGWLADLLAARDRRQGAPTAPPQGLTLWRVAYGEDRPVP
jgi:tRNA pseudouridine38-40 synthase